MDVPINYRGLLAADGEPRENAEIEEGEYVPEPHFEMGKAMPDPAGQGGSCAPVNSVLEHVDLWWALVLFNISQKLHHHLILSNTSANRPSPLIARGLHLNVGNGQMQQDNCCLIEDF